MMYGPDGCQRNQLKYWRKYNGRKTKTSNFSAWNKGLDKSDDRVKINIENRNKTMLERYGTLGGNKVK